MLGCSVVGLLWSWDSLEFGRSGVGMLWCWDARDCNVLMRTRY